MNQTEKSTQVVITPEAVLEHWQGHRRLTRRVIEKFPDDKLFSYAIGGMRPFSALAMEMMTMALPGIHGIVSGQWDKITSFDELPEEIKTKDDILKRWDRITDEINDQWSKIPSGRFLENDVAFGLYEGPVYWTLFYFIDNEVHHRAQGYVYLRSLGIEPPPFWER
jgi:uncharacterized damage-inducible protein DinB